MENAVTIIDPKEFGLKEENANKMVSGLNPIIEERSALEQIYAIVIKKELTPELLKEARELRLKIRDNRTKGIEVWHKTTKDYFLKGGQFVDAIKRKENVVNELMEAKLSEIEKYFENIEAERIKALHTERAEKLKPFGYEIGATNFGLMDDNMFNAILVGAEKTHKDKLELEAKIEADRIEKERLEAEEREKQRIENERLKAENEAKEKQLAAERIEAEKKQAELKAKADAELAEQKRIADIEAKKQADIIAAQKLESDKLAAELKAKADAEAKEKQAKIDEENKRIADEKKAAKQPDKEKLRSVAMQVNELKNILPEMKTEEGKKVLESIKGLLDKVIFYTKEQTEKL